MPKKNKTWYFVFTIYKSHEKAEIKYFKNLIRIVTLVIYLKYV